MSTRPRQSAKATATARALPRTPAGPPPHAASSTCGATTNAGDPCPRGVVTGRDRCLVHSKDLALEGRRAGGRAATARATLTSQAAGELVQLGDLASAVASAQRVARAVASGELDHKVGNLTLFAVNVAISAHRAQAEIDKRETKRLEEMPDAELDAAFDRALEAHLAKVRSAGA